MGKAFISVFFIFFAQIAYSTNKKKLNIAVASSMSAVMEQARHPFEDLYPQCQISLSIAGSSSLYHNIIQGADYSIFMGADKIWPERIQISLSLSTQPILYANGQAYLWIKKGHEIDTNQELVIANYQTTPYGKAAYNWLNEEGLWNGLKINKKIITASSAAKVPFITKQGGFTQAILPQAFLNQLPKGAKSQAIANMHHYMIKLKSGSCEQKWEDFIMYNKEFTHILNKQFYKKPSEREITN